jgi:hypothetical protein
MSLLVEIATRADVPLESVVRVLTRETVNDDHKTRVLAVLDHLDAEETRVLQRFALAAVHDALPPGGFARLDHEAVVAELVEAPLELPEAVHFDVEPVASTEIEEAQIQDAEVEALPAQTADTALVQLGSVLSELTDAVRELRHETDAERRERVDDLAVLIDLISKGWEGVDRRLGRVERQLGRLETAPPSRALPVAAPIPVEPTPPVPDPEPPPPPPDAVESSTLRRRLPMIAALAFGIGVGAVLALDLDSRFAASAVVGKRSTAEAAQRASLPATVAQQPVQVPTTTVQATLPTPKPATTKPRTTPAATTVRTTPASRPAARPATTARATTTAAAATQAPARPRAPTASTTAPPPATTTSRSAASPPPTPPEFTPSRNWAWPPADGVSYYLVEFFREGKLLYKAATQEARLTLPDSVKFTPGVYRWRVRPGHGAPDENRLDAPIVDSEFTLT